MGLPGKKDVTVPNKEDTLKKVLKALIPILPIPGNVPNPGTIAPKLIIAVR